MGRRDKKCECEEGSPRWMTTYGDMMTLLLTFFVMLVSMSSIQETKFRKAIGSLIGALGVMRMDSAIIKYENPPLPKDYQREIKKIRQQFKKFKGYLEEKNLEDDVEVTETEEGMLIRMANPVLFNSGEAEIREKGFNVLTKLSTVLARMNANIKIEGHTDNVPIHTDKFPSNWELSAARAVRVLRLFASHDIPGKSLTAVGRGEYFPLVDNSTPENRSKNRRVEIYVNYKEKLKKEVVRKMLEQEENNGG